MSMTDQQPMYSTKDVVLLSGLSYRQLDHYDRLGVLQPSLASASGSSTRRRYSPLDVAIARVLYRLSAMDGRGGRLKLFEVVVDLLRSTDPWPEVIWVGRSGEGDWTVGLNASVSCDCGWFIRIDEERP